MSTITPEQQSEVDSLALDYVKLHGMRVALDLSRERGDRLQKAVMEAVMWLSIGETTRAQQTLNQALTA